MAVLLCATMSLAESRQLAVVFLAKSCRADFREIGISSSWSTATRSQVWHPVLYGTSPVATLARHQRIDWLIEPGLTSHQTHYRSYWGRVFMGQMT